MNQPKPWPSAAPLALASAAVSVGLLAAALGLVGETAAVSQRAWAFAIPPVVSLIFSALYVRLVHKAEPQGASLRRIFKGVAAICLLSGFACGIFLVIWYRYLFPGVMENRMAEAERQMAEDGYSPGDIEDYLHRSRVVLYGPLGMFLGGIFWSIGGLIPSSLLVLFSRR